MSSEMMSQIMIMLIIALLLVSFLFLVLKLLFQQEQKSKSPYNILEERFINGEITEEEFIKRKKVLK
ncbi:SHOCT domain-containing protein [Alkalihalobacillus sp. 1P02AB]|uniref:SHOCT domain-containing protein n=1 Tax=Alkalihalobacillus sp. 1P02AB TaxID=3132260 RepID=UPI0039A75FA7